MQKFLTPKQAARRLGTTEANLQVRRVRNNGPKFSREGRSVFYNATDLKKWQEAGNTMSKRSTKKAKKTSPKIVRVTANLKRATAALRLEKARLTNYAKTLRHVARQLGKICKRTRTK